jgi:protein TonB
MTKSASAFALLIGLGMADQATPQQGDVTTAPVVVKSVGASYTPRAMAQQQQGLVALAVTVKPDGTVGKVRITKHLSRELDGAAVRAAKQWRFRPGLKNGKPVPVETTIEMAFSMR